MPAPATVPARDIFLEANGIRHHLIARGSPGTPPVMMIHGLAGQARVFDAIASRLASHFHVYCLDVRGRGESGWGPPDGYHMENYVADLEAVRQSLGLGGFALVGTSMGGLIAMYYAARYPDHARRLVLNDIGPEIDPAGLARIARYIGSAPDAFKDMKAVVKYYREHYAPMVEHLAEEQIVDFARHNVRKDDSGLYVWKMDPAIRKAGPVAPPADPWDAFRALRCPILILHGERSDILSADAIGRMREAQPGARVVEVPGVGHAPMLMEPVAVEALETFLAGADEGTAG